MQRSESDARGAVDPRIDSAAREGLTGTAPADLYGAREREQITLPPDGSALEQQPAWRQDFPIDWPQDQYVERRDFLQFLILISGAFVVGQVWIGVHGWWRRRRSALPARRIAALADVPVGGTLAFAYPTDADPNVLVRLDERTVVAYGQKCTHLSCAVVPKPAEGVFHCPCHEGLFDIRSGAPIAGPPRRPLPRVVLELRGDEVWATAVEQRTS
jgi:nitrite reductase/ring-hydroxylating ferredoxin subunit